MGSMRVGLVFFLAFSILSAASAIQMTAVKGETFVMKCYDDALMTDLTDSYVEVIFTPFQSSVSTIIAKYKPNEQPQFPDGSPFSSRLIFTPESSFTITDIRVSDEGKYECILRAFNLIEEPKKSNDLQVFVRPDITVRLLNNPLLEGSGSVPAAECIASNAKPVAKVCWGSSRHLQFNHTNNTGAGTEPSTMNSKATLMVSRNKFYNGQPFSCMITHPALSDGGVNVSIIHLDVRYHPSIPSIRVINQNTQLNCSSDGNPTPIISWIMPNNNQPPDPTTGSSQIRIISPNLPERQNDTYTCKASNGIEPETEASITTSEAVEYEEIVKTSNTGLIVGVVIGTILLLVVIAALVYWLCIRKQREKDSGPYNPKKITRQTDDDEGGWSRSSGRPMIQHANESLNKNAPPGPTQPPPHDDDEGGSNYSHSDVEEFTKGHDVDLNSPQTGEEEDDMPTTGIVSKNSVNFQHRRQRPSTSPHRASQNKGKPQPSPRTPQQSDPHYEVPPKEYYGDDYDQEGHPFMGDQHYPDEDLIDDQFYDRPEDRYPGYQPSYDEPPYDGHLPPYSDTVHYASIDHIYDEGQPRTRPPYQEPVEYAEIRSKGQIV